MTDTEITELMGETDVINKTIQVTHPDGNILNISTNSVILDDIVYGDYKEDNQPHSVLKDSIYGQFVRAKLLQSYLTFSGLLG